MTTQMDAFIDLLKTGKRAEARVLLEAGSIKAKFAPDAVTQKQGEPPVFKSRGKKVELDDQGNWRLKKK